MNETAVTTGVVDQTVVGAILGLVIDRDDREIAIPLTEQGLQCLIDVLDVVDPDPEDEVLPNLYVEIVDAVTAAGDGACEGELTLLNDDLEAPSSSSDPSP